MAEHALTDPNAKVRAAAARTLGLVKAVSSVPKLQALLNDKEPAVVLAAAHSLFLLGDQNDTYDIDYQVLVGERKSADGFVQSHIAELRDPKAVAMMGPETGVGFMPFGGEAYEALAKACSDKRPAVRAAAVYAIAKRDNPAMLYMIISSLEDKNEVVRYDAASAVLRLSVEKSSE